MTDRKYPITRDHFVSSSRRFRYVENKTSGCFIEEITNGLNDFYKYLRMFIIRVKAGGINPLRARVIPRKDSPERS